MDRGRERRRHSDLPHEHSTALQVWKVPIQWCMCTPMHECGYPSVVTRYPSQGEARVCASCVCACACLSVCCSVCCAVCLFGVAVCVCVCVCVSNGAPRCYLTPSALSLWLLPTSGRGKRFIKVVSFLPSRVPWCMFVSHPSECTISVGCVRACLTMQAQKKK